MYKLKIHFLGASKTVTGSKFLLETPEKNILIDCGMFQGLKELRQLNWKDFPFPAEKIDCILLTHGHLDHTAYIPRLVKQGFKGKIIATAPTLAITSIILRDTAKIQEEDAERANEEGFSKHEPALPFYTIEEAEKALEFFHSAEIDTWQQLSANIKFRFQKNGHIIGSTFLELEIYERLFIFSGDIGRKNDELLEDPQQPKWADFLFVESTYGDRLHTQIDGDEILIDSIHETLEKQGNLIIPSFAVERLQTLMYKLWKLQKQNHIPSIPIFVDSPMGNEVMKVFENFPEWHKLSAAEFKAMSNYFNIITSYKDTWKTLEDPRPKIVIAGSGMVTGGRVLTYLRYLIDKPETTVLLAGYQAEGTRGRKLLEGEKEIKIFGKYITVNAKIKSMQSISAHADQQGLLDWMRGIQNIPEKVFLIHGEEQAMQIFKTKIAHRYKWQVSIPSLNEIVELHL